jgi:YVTN family beta-propeller protein
VGQVGGVEMRAVRPSVFIALVFAVAQACIPLIAQTLIDTIPVGNAPVSVAANPRTNKVYVVNQCGSGPACDYSNGTVSVIDGATDLVTATITVGSNPGQVAINQVTNKIYVTDSIQGGNSTVTVIDGETNATATVYVGVLPSGLAVNPITNKIYVSNYGSNSVTVVDGVTLSTTTIRPVNVPERPAINTVTNKIYVANDTSPGTLTVIDGASNSQTTISVGAFPTDAAIDELTNKIYVPNSGDSTVTVVDGATLATTTVSGIPTPFRAAVNPVTNNIYVSSVFNSAVVVINGFTLATTSVPLAETTSQAVVNPVTNKIYLDGGTSSLVSMVDGANNTVTSVEAGYIPDGMALNATTNRTYVANQGGNTLSVIAGASSDALQLVPVTPCRVVDTRNSNGPFGGPPIQGGTLRSFPIPQQTACGIPAGAGAYSLNVTLVPIQDGSVGYLTIWPTGLEQPLISTMNSLDGRIKANAAIVPGGYQGAVSVYAANTTNVIIDIDGYFATPSSSTLAFYPVPPCRVADTRSGYGPLQGPYMQGGQERDFPIFESYCGLPSTVQAYSMNLTVVPHPAGQPLSYLTVWPAEQQQPLVSTLNNLTGTIVANAAIVAAGQGGEGSVAVYPSDNTDLIIDVNGYFAPASGNGNSLYPSSPCRVLDTRTAGGAFSGELDPPIAMLAAPCGLSGAAQAYVLNATVVPAGQLGYLSLWPDGTVQPLVSTLNAPDGAITSNMAVVPNVDGSLDAYASGLTQLILDISSYFAP